MGKYVDGNLIRDEKLIYEAKLHWIIFLSIKAIFTLFIGPIIQRSTSEFAITNKRIIMKVGLISRNTLEMNREKVETVNVNQSVLGRMFNYGTIGIIGSGGTKEYFPRISNPLEFRKRFQEVA